MAKIFNHDTTNPDLKPCPFCGTVPVWYLEGNNFTPSRTVVIKCPHCRAEMRSSGLRLSGEELADIVMDKWNTRAV